MMNEELLTANQVAATCKISIRQVWRWRDAGTLPEPIKFGRITRWKSSDISAWIADNCPDVRRTGWAAK